MEPATIMILALCAGVAALLLWFEIDSRRNQARARPAAKLLQSPSKPSQQETKSEAESVIEKPKAA